jgi:hypothetical protein
MPKKLKEFRAVRVSWIVHEFVPMKNCDLLNTVNITQTTVSRLVSNILDSIAPNPLYPTRGFVCC